MNHRSVLTHSKKGERLVGSISISALVFIGYLILVASDYRPLLIGVGLTVAFSAMSTIMIQRLSLSKAIASAKFVTGLILVDSALMLRGVTATFGLADYGLIGSAGLILAGIMFWTGALERSWKASIR